MNLYVLVEGIAEMKVYPLWIKYLTGSSLSQCAAYTDVEDNQFFVFECGGLGRMIHHAIGNAMREIAAYPVFDFFIIIADAEDGSVSSRSAKIEAAMAGAGVNLPANCQYKILVQRVCIESWLCGHIDFFRLAQSSANKNVQKFITDYDVAANDPEQMPANPQKRAEVNHLTIGQYHAAYLHHMLIPAGIRYKKSAAGHTIDISYLERLRMRKMSETPAHLDTFGEMVAFFSSL